MESLSHRKTSNFSIAAIMSGIQAKTEPIEAAEPDTKNDSKNSDDSSDNLAGLDKVVVKKEKKSKISEECNCEELSRVNCNLDNKDLWDKFCEFGTEMIITRTGRRMFPTVRITFNDVDQEPGVKYHVVLDIPPCDNKRYRYAYHRSSWLVAGKADPAPPHRLYCHPDAPFTAEQLKKQVISFEKVKVTNNESDNTGQVMVNITIFLVHCSLKNKYCSWNFSPSNDFFNHGGNLSQITTKTLSRGSLFAKEFTIIIKILCQKFVGNKRL